MSISLPIKTKRRSTAAYAASQPLFDALRNGMQTASHQRQNLETARNAAQNLHVKLPSTSISDGVRDDHATYMDGAVNAWRLATESYAEIFEALAAVTAAEPSTDRKEREGHGTFTKMAHNARLAHETAMDWKLTTPPASAGSKSSSVPTADEDAEMQDRIDEHEDTSDAIKPQTNSATTAGAPAAEHQLPTNAILASLLKKHNASLAASGEESGSPKVDDARKKNDTPNVEDAALRGNPAKAQKLDKRKKRREKRKAARVEERNAEKEQPQTAAAKPNEGPAAPAYEDVSAEVAARLAAKDTKKESKKEKKRKRESRDSFGNEAITVKEAEAVAKPNKKKAKSNVGEPVEDVTKKEKARKHVREADDANGDVEHAKRSKRKKV